MFAREMIKTRVTGKTIKTKNKIAEHKATMISEMMTRIARALPMEVHTVQIIPLVADKMKQAQGILLNLKTVII